MFSLIEELQFVLEPQIRPFCGPLFFSRSLKSALGNVTANGSFGLVDTGQKKLLVTCHHVWDEFQKAREKDSQLRIFACLDKDSPVVLNQEPLDENRNLDIATFDIEPLLPACVGRKFYALHQNPAHQVRIGDQLLVVGYPGLLRTATEKSVGFARRRYAVDVCSVDGFCFHANISEAKILFEEKPESVEEADWHGGISGSPCFWVRQDRLPRLVGFVKSYWMEYLWFTDVKCLDRGGTINKQPSSSKAT